MHLALKSMRLELLDPSVHLRMSCNGSDKALKLHEAREALKSPSCLCATTRSSTQQASPGQDGRATAMCPIRKKKIKIQIQESICNQDPFMFQQNKGTDKDFLTQAVALRSQSNENYTKPLTPSHFCSV